MRSHAKAPSAGSVWIAAASVFVLSLLLLAATSESASAVSGRPYLQTIPTAPGTSPGGLAADSAGDIYILNSAERSVEKLDSAGNPVNFSASASYISGNKLTGGPGGPFNGVSGLGRDIAVDQSSGYIYVPSWEGEGRPRDKKNNLLPPAPGIMVYDPSGAYAGFISTGLDGQCGVGIQPTSGDIYATSEFSPAIERYEVVDGNADHDIRNGTLRLAKSDSEDSFGGCAIKIDSTGTIYLAAFNPGISRVRKYNQSQVSPPSGPFSPAVGTPVIEGGGATALAVEPSSDNLFVDQGDRGVELTPTGSVLAEYSGLGSSKGTVFSGGKLFVSRADGGIYVFGDLTQLPIAKTEGISDLIPDQVTLHGEVDPDAAGDITGCEFKYGHDQRYAGGSVPCSSSLPITNAKAVEAPLNGLDPATTYHYQLVAENGNGAQIGADQTFTTPPSVESLATGDATDVTKTTATLHGSFVGNGEDVHYYFEYGTSPSYGQTSPAPPGNDAGSATGPQEVGAVPISGLQGGTEYHYRVVASTFHGKTVGEDRTFTTAAAVTNLATEAATGFTDTSAELHGSFEADSFETHYYFEWGESTEYGKITPLAPGNAVPPGSGHVDLPPVTISGLLKGSTYHYRVVATNAAGITFGADASFSTAEAPLITNLNTRNVTATAAELTAEVNPRRGQTSYHFEWGPTSTYGNSIPVPAGDAGSGDSLVPVRVQLEGLTSGVTYHFRLVATNQYGSASSADQTFGFYPPNCPNAQLRQETRSNSLPDCRAYELVTPGFGQGATILAQSGPVSPLATSPSKIAFAVAFGTFPEDSGDPSNISADQYFATRTDTGWRQQLVSQSATEAFWVGGPPEHYEEPVSVGQRPPNMSYFGSQTNPDMSRFINYDRGWPSNALTTPSGSYQLGHPSNAPFVWDTTTGALLERWPTNLFDVPGGVDFVGTPEASEDFSHFVFQSNVPFAPGGNAAKRSIACCSPTLATLIQPPASIYDNDLGSGAVRLASIKGDNSTFEGFVFGVSDDGARILMSEEDPTPWNLHPAIFPGPMFWYAPGVQALDDILGPLYLRADGERTYEIAPGRLITWVGSSGDGKSVYLRSAEQLTPDDHDKSTDLYVWREASQSLTRISTGNFADAGNRESCAATWSGGGCNVEVIDLSQVGNKTTDRAISKSGDIYFLSPEQLVQGKGVPGRANLYLYRKGSLRFVAALDPEADSAQRMPVSRMQITPDGEHMAFVSKSSATEYDTAGHATMYTYEPESGRVSCASCRPDGKPPVSDVSASLNGLFQTYDGRAFFTTADALVPNDSNEVADVYEYTEGRPQLISSGLGFGVKLVALTGGPAGGLIGVSANGLDAYFATLDNLVSQDHNGQEVKIYDARIGGGFPAERTQPNCTSADECHGPGANPPGPMVDRTSAHLGKRATPKAKKHRKKAKAHKKKHKRGKKAKSRGNNAKQGGSHRG